MEKASDSNHLFDVNQSASRAFSIKKVPQKGSLVGCCVSLRSAPRR
jgi:hypothetical protein